MFVTSRTTEDLFTVIHRYVAPSVPLPHLRCSHFRLLLSWALQSSTP